MMLNWDQTFIILLHIAQYCDKMIIHEKNYFSKFTHLPNFYLWELSFDILDFIPSICLQHKIKCFRGIKLTLFSMFLTSQCTPYCKTAHIPILTLRCMWLPCRSRNGQHADDVTRSLLC